MFDLEVFHSREYLHPQKCRKYTATYKYTNQKKRGDCMVSWGRAFKGAAGILGFAIIWWFVGGILIGAGLIISGLGLSFAISGGSLINFVVGGILIFIGYIIGILGTLAAYLKILSEIVAEEVKKP